MRRIAATFALLAVASPAVLSAATSSFEYNDARPAPRLRWPSKSIKVAISKSLSAPGANVKLGSDVVGALRRALSRWSDVTEIVFEVSETSFNSISSAKSGDGISLITVADTPQNNSIFAGSLTTGRTRVFFNEETGEISEADVVINPHPTSADGLPVQFSTDGTSGTYDLESTFTHEIGHLLGLDHSPVISSTMHSQQALNGVYKKPAFTERTLSEEDRVRVRSLYSALPDLTTVEGRINQLNSFGQQTPASKTEVWVEDTHSGRVIASAVTSANGSFRIENLSPSNYRVMSRNMTSSHPLSAHGSTLSSPIKEVSLRGGEGGVVELSTSSASRYLNPRFIGTAGELSTTPISVDVGRSVRLYVAGEGLDQLSPDGITVTSTFFKVNQASIQKETFPSAYPVISFEVTVAANAPFGDYTIRLQSRTSEVAFVPGALTVDPAVESSFASPSDDPQFFVRQHYRDFLGREADGPGLEYWTSQLDQCGQDAECRKTRRLKISAAFFSQPEFQEKGAFIHRLYRAAFGRIPSFPEFESSREQLLTSKLEVAQALTESEEFRKLFPLTLTAPAFLDAILKGVRDGLGVDLATRRGEWLPLLGDPLSGRAKLVQAIADDREVIEAEHDGAFVLMQYFGYLQRDAEEEGFKFWLNVLNTKGRNDPARFTSVSCVFVNSAEYQSRFGMVLTHDPSECANN